MRIDGGIATGTMSDERGKASHSWWVGRVTARWTWRRSGQLPGQDDTRSAQRAQHGRNGTRLVMSGGGGDGVE